MNKKQYKIGIIGASIQGIIEECVDAAALGNQWRIIDIDTTLRPKSKFSIINKLGYVFNFLRNIIQIQDIDILVLVFVDRLSPWYARVAHLLNKKVVFYWLGSDVWSLCQSACNKSNYKSADLNLSYSEGNAKELEKIGIKAEVVACMTKLNPSAAKMPQEHSILLSIPDEQRFFYGYDDMIKLIKEFPNIKFHIVRSERSDLYPYANVVFEGMLDKEQMEEVFNNISIVVRWPEHDGTSLILSEAALKGKYIISKNPFPCGIISENYDDLVNSVNELITKPLEPCEENRAFALKRLTQAYSGRKFIKYIESIVD